MSLFELHPFFALCGRSRKRKKGIYMLIESNLHPRSYSEKEVCRIVNELQYKKYVKHRVFPIDMYPGITEDGKDIIVYIFLREETKDLYQAWLNHELT